MVKKNSLYAWYLATRPKTLAGAAAPVLLALATAMHQFRMINTLPALLCLFFALLMQVDANLINDYYDCVCGVDGEERLGPERACSQGWISLQAMRMGIFVTTLLACLAGFPLVAWGGWESIAVGMACVVFCFLYTTLFSRIAMGDILVILFFGIIPVGYTFFFQSIYTSITDIPAGVWFLALAQGLVTDCLLLVNNFRDRDTDAAAGKTTLVTIIGPQHTLRLYYIIGILSVALAVCGINLLSAQFHVYSLLPMLFIPLHTHIYQRMYATYSGKGLNRVLGMTAMSILCFAILASLSLMLT